MYLGLRDKLLRTSSKVRLGSWVLELRDLGAEAVMSSYEGAPVSQEVMV